MKNFTKHMTLKVTDFGPINKAEIDLRPLTVFLGPNNVGKSYLAILIYALHRSMSDSESNYIERRLQFRHDREMLDSKYLKKNDLKALVKWAKEVGDHIDISLLLNEYRDSPKNKNKAIIDNKKTIMIPDFLIRLLRPIFEKLARPFTRELSRCFGINLAELKRKNSNKNTNISIISKKTIESEIQNYKLIFSPFEKKSKTNFSKAFKIELNIKQSLDLAHILTRLFDFLSVTNDEKDKDLQNKYLIEEFITSLSSFIHHCLTDPFCNTAFYLPADRTGIMHAHNVLVSSLIQNATMAGFHHANPTPKLSGVLADFIEGLISIDNHMDIGKRKKNDHTRKIEELLDGQVHIEKEEVSNYPRFTYQPEGWNENLSLMNASSMVTELAPVIFYFRHKIQSKNVLIIEEPESHLHPTKQVEFINLLADWIKSGIRVIITTHSEWILEALSNIVNRSERSLLKTESNNDEILLSQENVGVWLFKKDSVNGSSVEEIKFDENDMYSSDFEEVAQNLHNDWVNLTNNGKEE